MSSDLEDMEEFRRLLLDWCQSNLREFPWRGDVSPYDILIAEILLSATSASKVEPIYRKFLSEYPDFDSLANADEGELTSLLEPLGLQNRRATALVELGQRLKDESLPTSVDALRQLPWVDYYGAHALLCFGFGERQPIVDTNVTRIFNRVFGTDFTGSEDGEAWEFAESLLPERDVQKYNLGLVDLGAMVCTATNPRCDACPLSDICRYYIEQT